MKRLYCFLSNEKGSVNVIFVFSLVGLLSLSALVIDAGVFYLEDTRLSNAVDAAALAGSQALTNDDPYGARAAAEEYAIKNGLNPEDFNIIISMDGTSISVTGVKDAPIFFGKVILDAETLRLERKATVAVGNVGAMMGVAPIGIPDSDFVFGEKYSLKIAAGDEFEEELGVGNYGALALGATGASTYEENLTDGYQEMITVGDVIDTQTGNISNPTKRAIDKRIASAMSVSYEDVPSGCPRVLYVPVFEAHEADGNQVKSVKVVSFAAFWVDEVVGQGNENQINGYFIRRLAEGEIRGDAVYRGLKTVKLVE